MPELQATVFNTFWREGETWVPAFAGYASLRIPTGYQSANVDGKYGAILTKTLFPRFRMHLEGWLMNACGGPGEERHFNYLNGLERRAFQWAVGPGVDYQIGDATLVALNYLHEASETAYKGNTHVIEAGVVHRFGETQRLYHSVKGAVDVGASGQYDEPHLGLKLQYELNLK